MTLVVALAAKRFAAADPVHDRRDDRRQPVRLRARSRRRGHGPVLGALPSRLPPLSLPSFDPETWRKLLRPRSRSPCSGSTEAVSIARAVARQAGQRIDGNQEFIGQGLSNIVGAFCSAYPSSGSFNRSGVNYEAGARTPLAAVSRRCCCSSIVLLVSRRWPRTCRSP